MSGVRRSDDPCVAERKNLNPVNPRLRLQTDRNVFLCIRVYSPKCVFPVTSAEYTLKSGYTRRKIEDQPNVCARDVYSFLHVRFPSALASQSSSRHICFPPSASISY